MDPGGAPERVGMLMARIRSRISRRSLTAASGPGFLRQKALNPRLYQPITVSGLMVAMASIGQPQAPRCPSPQHVHPMAENQILSFESAARLHQRRQLMNQQFEQSLHARE